MSRTFKQLSQKQRYQIQTFIAINKNRKDITKAVGVRLPSVENPKETNLKVVAKLTFNTNYNSQNYRLGKTILTELTNLSNYR